MAEDETDNWWLQQAGLKQYLDWHHWMGCLIPIFVLLTLVLILVFKLSWWLLPSAVLLSVAANVFRKWVFFNRIYCARCGYNPTRRKADGEPRKDYYKVLAQLRRYERCPECGDTGKSNNSAQE